MHELSVNYKLCGFGDRDLMQLHSLSEPKTKQQPCIGCARSFQLQDQTVKKEHDTKSETM